jgi:hypothetical protein
VVTLIKKIIFIFLITMGALFINVLPASAQGKETSPTVITASFTGDANFLPTKNPLDVFLRIDGEIRSVSGLGSIRILALGQPTPWGSIILRRSGARISLPGEKFSNGVIYLYSSNLIQGYFKHLGYGFALTLRSAGGFKLEGTLIARESLDPSRSGRKK